MADEIQQKIEVLSALIQTAEDNIAQVKAILSQLIGQNPDIAPASYAFSGSNGNGNGNGKKPLNGLSVACDGRVIEGVFDGESMIGPDSRRYPVPPNYASKSKLVSGDILKLTIAENGSFIYKQIGPVERVQVVGALRKIGADYHVDTPQGDFRVLTASVTYFKAVVGDQVTVIVPAGSSSGWGAIENVIPKIVKIDSLDSVIASSKSRSQSTEPEDFELPKMLFKRN